MRRVLFLMLVLVLLTGCDVAEDLMGLLVADPDEDAVLAARRVPYGVLSFLTGSELERVDAYATTLFLDRHMGRRPILVTGTLKE